MNALRFALAVLTLASFSGCELLDGYHESTPNFSVDKTVFAAGEQALLTLTNNRAWRWLLATGSRLLAQGCWLRAAGSGLLGDIKRPSGGFWFQPKALGSWRLRKMSLFA